MKNQAVLALIIIGCISSCRSQDHVSSLLGDRSYVAKEIDCILDKGPCDAIGRQIKSLLPEVVNNDCQRCTPRQLRNARRLIRFMEDQHPEEWRTIMRYYSSRNEKFLRIKTALPNDYNSLD